MGARNLNSIQTNMNKKRYKDILRIHSKAFNDPTQCVRAMCQDPVVIIIVAYFLFNSFCSHSFATCFSFICSDTILDVSRFTTQLPKIFNLTDI